MAAAYAAAPRDPVFLRTVVNKLLQGLRHTRGGVLGGLGRCNLKSGHQRFTILHKGAGYEVYKHFSSANDLAKWMRRHNIEEIELCLLYYERTGRLTPDDLEHGTF